MIAVLGGGLANVTTALPRSILDTDHLDPRDRYDAWRDSFNVVFGYNVDERVAASAFRGRIDNTLFDHFMLTHFCASSANYERSNSRVGRDSVDMVMLQLYLQGPCHYTIDGKQGDSKVGDIVVMDMSREINTWHDFQENLTLCFPRSVLQDALPNLDTVHGAILDRRNPLTTILRSHMQSLHDNVDQISPEQGAALTPSTVELAAAAVRAALGDGVDDSAPLRQALRDRADRAIEQLLDDPDLSPDRLALAVPCSRSRLYALYSDDGGVMSYVLKQRLRRVLQGLVAAQHRNRTISAIAGDCGFSNIASFNRAFKAEFGVTPSQARHETPTALLHHVDRQVQIATDGSRDYESWVVNRLSSRGRG